MRAGVVAVPGAVRRGPFREVARDPHRVDPHHNGGVHLDRELQANLVTLPEILDLGRLALWQADPGVRAVALEVADAVRIIEAEAPSQLGNGDVRA